MNFPALYNYAEAFGVLAWKGLANFTLKNSIRGPIKNAVMIVPIPAIVGMAPLFSSAASHFFDFQAISTVCLFIFTHFYM